MFNRLGNKVHKTKTRNYYKYTRIKHDFEISYLEIKVTLTLRNDCSPGPRFQNVFEFFA